VSVTAKIHSAATSPSEGELAQRWLGDDFMERATSALGVEDCFVIRATNTKAMTFGRFSNAITLPTGRNMLWYGTLTAARTVASGDSLVQWTIASNLAQPIYRLVSVDDHATDPTPIVSTLDTLLGKPKANPLEGYEQYSEPNWDGHNAEPITAETLQYAGRLLKIIPETFGVPDIAPSADGSIGLEWVLESGPLHKLFFDIGPGQAWRAYWNRRDSGFGRLAGPGWSSFTKDTLQKLFNDLSQ
jgi:hypothetical protein